jgi:drug/metabolite transporter (DMT)-like permease
MFIVILFAMSILFGAVGALLMKIGASQMGAIQLGSLQAILGFIGKMLTNVTVLGGMSMYFLSAALWLYLLTKLDVSVVQPILALTYVVTPILAVFFIGEDVPLTRWVGIFVIILGVYIVARTAAA